MEPHTHGVHCANCHAEAEMVAVHDCADFRALVFPVGWSFVWTNSECDCGREHVRKPHSPTAGRQMLACSTACVEALIVKVGHAERDPEHDN